MNKAEKALEAIAKEYNENSIEYSYYKGIGDRRHMNECGSVMYSLDNILEAAYEFPKDYTKVKATTVYQGAIVTYFECIVNKEGEQH